MCLVLCVQFTGMDREQTNKETNRCISENWLVDHSLYICKRMSRSQRVFKRHFIIPFVTRNGTVATVAILTMLCFLKMQYEIYFNTASSYLNLLPYKKIISTHHSIYFQSCSFTFDQIKKNSCFYLILRRFTLVKFHAGSIPMNEYPIKSMRSI